MGPVIKKTWPNILSDVSRALAYTWGSVNLFIVSQIIWPGDSLHVTDLGLFYGIGVYVVAVSGLLFGLLADRYSRVKLQVLITFFYGLSFLLNGFVPAGPDPTSFTWFFALNVFRQTFDGGGAPVAISYMNDAAEETERSQYFGAIQIIHQLFWLGGMFISAIMFQNAYWREFFWVIGAIIMASSLIIALKAKEPKRGATKVELKADLQSDKARYEYKLTRETARQTLLSKTNVIVFVEGVFTNVVGSIPLFLMQAYLQDTLYHFAPLVISAFAILFCFPGTIFGSVVLSKRSDLLGNQDIRNRVYIIVVGLVSVMLLAMILFFIPLTPMSAVEGADFGFVLTRPWHWILIVIDFLVYFVIILYSLNQGPILQKINLPEAQGTITAANQFLEFIGHGTGPIILGSLFAFFGNSYQLTVFIAVIIGVPGILCWLFSAKHIKKDVEAVSTILKQRAEDLQAKTTPNSNR